MAGDDGSLLYISGPGRPVVLTLEPCVSLADSATPFKPCPMCAGVSSEHVTDFNQFFPILAVVQGWIVCPPILGFEVFLVHPFSPEVILFGGYRPNEFSHAGRVP